MLSVALSMDACAVSMTNGMVYCNVKKLHMVAMPVLFGLFQGLMPLVGYFAGGLFAEILERFSGIVILAILGAIGGKMVYEGLTHKEECEEHRARLTLAVLLMQAVATSIDAFAVGVAFTAMKVAILPTVAMIACITAALVVVSLFIGRYAGDLLGAKAEVFGGIILIIIGVKAIL